MESIHRILYSLPQYHQRTTLVVPSASKDPYKILNIPPGSSASVIRASYYQLIKKLHPDVNQEDNATQIAIELNIAYGVLMKGIISDQNDNTNIKSDPFDHPESEATEIFVNPFSCRVSPLYWEQLQEIARLHQYDDPVEALQSNGAYPSQDAILYVTPQQLDLLIYELDRMTVDPLSMEVSEFYITNCVERARRTNSRF